MTNEKLLLEYEFAVGFYITAANNKDEETTEKYENYLQKLRSEILIRMKQN